MAVSALELRPRGAIALFDAAIHLASRASGLWALTLPGGALVTGATLQLVEAITHRRALLLPVALFTAAWFARGVFQGAAAHYPHTLLLSSQEPTAWGSLRAALARLPSLLITVGYLTAFNLVVGAVTLGLYFFFLGAHVVGYAVTMQGKGHPLALYGTCSRLLGGARLSAVWVRLLFWVQLLVLLNIHIAANVVVFLGQKLLALELSYAMRFVSVDNSSWVAVAVALAFTLFEPLRAAVATLLLVDGRVRQEGLDLLAAIQQLPRRQSGRPRLRPAPSPGSSATAAAVVVALVAALLAGPATAEAGRPGPPAPQHGADEDWGGVFTPGTEAGPEDRTSSSALQDRLGQVAEHCGARTASLDKQLGAAGELGERERGALSRFVADLESRAYDEEDCEQVSSDLRRGLPLIVQTRDAKAQQVADARTRARDILARPEFAPIPEAKETSRPEQAEEKVPPDQQGWWARFQRWLDDKSRDFRRWWERTMRDKRSGGNGFPSGIDAGGGGAALANALVMLLVAGVVLVLGWLLLRFRQAPSPASLGEVGGPAQVPLESDPMSALSRPPEGWAHLADELAARGEFREAVRSLYLALLSRLHRDGAIDYDPAKSNWDYFRGFKGRREHLPVFRDLTHRFDFAYYGNLGVTGEAYRAFRQLTQPLLAAPGPTEPAHA